RLSNPRRSARARAAPLGFLDERDLPRLDRGAAHRQGPVLALRGLSGRERGGPDLHVPVLSSAPRGGVGARAAPSGLLPQARSAEAPPPLIGGGSPAHVEPPVARLPCDIGALDGVDLRRPRAAPEPVLERGERGRV